MNSTKLNVKFSSLPIESDLIMKTNLSFFIFFVQKMAILATALSRNKTISSV